MYVCIYLFIYLYFLFWELTLGQTGWRIFVIHGSNDTVSRKGVPFGGFIDIAAHSGSQIPRKPRFWGHANAFSSQTREKFKLSYFRNYCIDRNQILHSDKDHLVPFVGDPRMSQTNPTWRTAAILKN